MDELEVIDNPGEETAEEMRKRLEQVDASAAPAPTDAPVAPAIPQLTTPEAPPAAPEIVPPTVTPEMMPPTNGLGSPTYEPGQKLGTKLAFKEGGDYPGKPFSWKTDVLAPLLSGVTMGAIQPGRTDTAYNKQLMEASMPGLGAGEAARHNTEAEIQQHAKFLETLGYDPQTAHASATKFVINPLQAGADKAEAASDEAKRQGQVSRGGTGGAFEEGASGTAAATAQNRATAATSANQSTLQKILAGLGAPGLKAMNEVAGTTAATNKIGRDDTAGATQFAHDQSLAGGKLVNDLAAQGLEGQKIKTAGMQEGVDQAKVAGLAKALQNDPAALAEVIKEILYGKDQVLAPGAAQIDAQTHKPVATNPIPLASYYNTDPRTGLPVEHMIRGTVPPGMEGQTPSYRPGQQIGAQQGALGPIRVKKSQ